jgi:N-acetylgalactosamine kinase
VTDTHGAALWPDEELQRVLRLADRFQRKIARAAAFVVRAPGRVNLLGEHTDYNGLPVLPMAIDRSILIAGAARSDRSVGVANTARRFPVRRFELADTIAPYAPGNWGNYAKAAAQGMMRTYGSELRHGADLLVDGNIPSGAGLSSSSALVVASALALLAANDVAESYEALAELLPTAERYVGTMSGGMDQATSLLAHAGHALRIDFFPLRVRTVPLPRGYSIVVCHSLVQAEKSGAAKAAYNLRVIECHLACRVLEGVLGARLPRGLARLGDLATLFPGRSLLEFIPCLAAHVPDRPLRLSEIAELVGTSPERLRNECEIEADVGDRFDLLRRVRHVWSEAERVEQAEEALRGGDAAAFGHLMNASHASCRDDYEISCPELETLVTLAKEAGALGARLTGAGFGGCTVNLVADSDVHAFLTRIDRYFYESRLGDGARVSDYRFIFRPQTGAGVLRL